MKKPIGKAARISAEVRGYSADVGADVGRDKNEAKTPSGADVADIESGPDMKIINITAV